MTATPASLRKNAFFGWKLALLAALANFMVQGGAVYLLNAFIEPFTELYKWNRGDMGLAAGIGSFCGMAATPVFASLGMRVPLRYIMTGGVAVGGICLFMLGRFSNLWLFTLNFSLLWIAGQACGGAVGNALMGNWFIKNKGRAYGIVNSGMSFSGAVLPFVSLLLITVFSVQTATAILGCFVLFVVLPAVWFFVRDTPEEMGLTPDGLPASPEPTDTVTIQAAETAQKSPDVAPAQDDSIYTPTIAELVRSPLVWRIGIAFSVSILACAGVVGQLKPRFSDLGFGDFTAMTFMCATAFCVASGAYIWGWLADRKNPLTVTRIMFFCNILAFSLAFLPQNIVTTVVFVVFGGIAMGGVWTCLPAVIVSVFGRKNYMAVYRVISLFIFFKSAGYIIMGKTHQWTGSYDAAFILFCCLCAVAMLLLPREGTVYRRPVPAA